MRKIEREKLRKISHLEDEYAHLFDVKVKMEHRMRDLEEEKKKKDKKIQTLEKQVAQVSEETSFLKELNNALKENQVQWQDKLKEADKKLEKELSERDKKISELQVYLYFLFLFQGTNS